MPGKIESAPNFVAIDFETANYYRRSACAVGLVKVEDGKITKKTVQLLKPPDRWFHFTYLHGIGWDDVKNEPTFKEYWPDLKKFIKGTSYFVAHNAPFDYSVLRICCENAGIETPDIDFICTLKLARDHLGIYPSDLESVCRKLKIPLDHHNPLSDAESCAQVALRALKKRYRFEPTRKAK